MSETPEHVWTCPIHGPQHGPSCMECLKAAEETVHAWLERDERGHRLLGKDVTSLGRLIASERKDAARRERNRLKALLEAKLLLPAKWILDIIDALPDEETP